MLQPGSAATPAPAPGMFAPMPFAVGQWAQYKMTDDKGQPSFMTQKIIGQEGGRGLAGIGERELLGPDDHEDAGRVRQPHGPEPGRDPGGVDEGHQGQRERDPAAGDRDDAVQLPGRGVVADHRWQGLPQEGTAVPAGHFDGCFKARTDAQWGPWRSVADSWAHPSVPLSGTVRSQGVDKPFTMELTAFGTSGAVSEF